MTSDTRTDMEKMARWSILYVMEHTFLVSYDEICDNLVQVIKKEKKGRKNIKKPTWVLIYENKANQIPDLYGCEQA